MKLAKYVTKLMIISAVSVVMLFVLLILVWCIPDRLVLDKQQESLSLFDEDGDVSEYPFTREETGWVWNFTHARGSQLDNGTDYTMILNVISDTSDATVIYKAMDCNDYARYWHGYLLFLRPMMLLFSYMQIRYIYMFVYMMLGVAILMRLNKNFTSCMAYLWAFALCFVNPVVLPFSLQFSSVFFIAMIGILVMDKVYAGCDLEQVGIVFIIIGILTSYFDFFTAPLLTLGLPLLYLMLLNYYKYGDDSLYKNMLTLINASITWTVGYFGCWCMKWIIATPILGRNVIQEGMQSVVRRTVETYHMKTLDYDTGSLRAIGMNLFAILPPGITSADWKWFLGVMILIILVLTIVLIKFHIDKSSMKALIPFLVLCIYPYIWFVVVSQHTSIHFLFTYRIQLISLLGFLIAYSEAIQIHKSA